MALKSATGKVFTLFHACLPENKEVERQLLLQEIFEMKEYRELTFNKNASSLMLGIYSKESLSVSDLNTLKNIKSALPLVDSALESLVSCKRYGNVSAIRELGKTDFTSKSSLETIIAQAQDLNEAENYTNISDTDVLAIFDEDTETEMADIAESFTIDDLQNNLSKILPKKMKDKKYWISANDFTSIQNEYLEQIELLKSEKNNIKKAKRKSFITKGYVSTCYLLLALCLCNTLDLFALSVFFGTSGIAWIIYLIKG